MTQIESSSCRVCQSAQRTAKSLNLATRVLRQEGLIKETFPVGGRAVSCRVVEERWKKWVEKAPRPGLSTEKKFRLAGAIKGTKTIFDEPCMKCDIPRGLDAIAKWEQKALFEERTTSGEVLEDIKVRARKLMGSKWWKGRDVEKEGIRVAVPDQQGCAELERGFGGTLSVIPWWYEEVTGHEVPPGFKPDGDLTFVTEHKDPTICRVGCAKTKAKLRVVTMQGAYTKRLLRPVHEAAYDHLSKKPWLVRGDVTAEHFEYAAYVNDPHNPSLSFSSGDYSDSTNNLHTDAVLAVVDVLCESLEEPLATILRSSFRDCWVWRQDGPLETTQFLDTNGVASERTEKGWTKRPIVRGSMMGNLCSFVVLCLLNKICYDRALVKANFPKSHPAIFNGDDCFFLGTDRLREEWVKSTAEVGFVINLDKTMVSRRYGDLNSTTYDYRRGRFIRKLSFGFLGSEAWKTPEESLAAPLFELCDRVQFATAAWLLNSYPIRALLNRAPVALSSIPRRWWNFLVKKSWFRATMINLQSEVETHGKDERKVPLVLGPPLDYGSISASKRAEVESMIRATEQDITFRWVRDNIGKPVYPLSKERPHRGACKARTHPGIRITRSEPSWRRLWMPEVLDILTSRLSANQFCQKDTTFVTDQPGLSTTRSLVLTPIDRSRGHPFAPPANLSTSSWKQGEPVGPKEAILPGPKSYSRGQRVFTNKTTQSASDYSSIFPPPSPLQDPAWVARAREFLLIRGRVINSSMARLAHDCAGVALLAERTTRLSSRQTPPSPVRLYQAYCEDG